MTPAERRRQEKRARWPWRFTPYPPRPQSGEVLVWRYPALPLSSAEFIAGIEPAGVHDNLAAAIAAVAKTQAEA